MPFSYSLHDDYDAEAWRVAKKLLQYSNDLVHSATKIICLAAHFLAKAGLLKYKL